MVFPVDDIVLGPASHGRLHRLDAIFGHTGEEPGFTRDHAIATAIWQRTNLGSYSFRVYDAASAGSKGGVMLNVPYLEASGGINPNSAAWAPERFPWIERELAKAGPCPVRGCAGPYRNPTMHAGQISFTGKTADLNAGKAPANYLPDAKRLIAWYETHPLRGPAPLVIVMHGHLQTNRSDWGTWMQSRLTAQEDEVKLSYAPRLWRTTVEAELRELPDLIAPVVARIPAGTAFFTVGSTFDQPGWFLLGVAGSGPERLLFARSSQLANQGRSSDLYGGIAAVVNAVVGGQPVPSGGGVAETEVKARENAARLAGFDAGKSAATGAYTSAGTKAAMAVKP